MTKVMLVNELHRSARRYFKRRRVIMKGIDDHWQADLVEMQPYATFNNGYRYLLVVIDTFSKYAWVMPCKTKTGLEVTNVFHSILKQGRIPKNLQTDDGGEFFNKHFKTLMDKFQINLYSTFSVMKASIVERLNRTIKEKMWKLFSLQGNYKWQSILPKIVLEYNTTKHSKIKMKPADVNKTNEARLLNTVYSNIKIAGPAKLNPGDLVRISKHKGQFEKGYTPNWSTEVFRIVTVKITNPVTYLLADLQSQPISGGFYEFELQKTKVSDIYLVEKILRKKGSKAYVKWLGISSDQNSWINIKDFV